MISKWNDDFSMPRNESFRKATKDYCMWLDADDVIPEREQQKIKKLKEQLTPDVSRGHDEVCNCF